MAHTRRARNNRNCMIILGCACLLCLIAIAGVVIGSIALFQTSRNNGINSNSNLNSQTNSLSFWSYSSDDQILYTVDSHGIFVSDESTEDLDEMFKREEGISEGNNEEIVAGLWFGDSKSGIKHAGLGISQSGDGRKALFLSGLLEVDDIS